MISQRSQTARSQLSSSYNTLARERKKLADEQKRIITEREKLLQIKRQLRQSPQKRVPFIPRKERFRVKKEKERVEQELKTGEVSLQSYEEQLKKSEQKLKDYENSLKETEKKIREEEDWEKARQIIYKGGSLLSNEKRFGSNSIKSKIRYLLEHGERTAEQIEKGLYPTEFLQHFVPRVEEQIKIKKLKPETVKLELSKALVGKESQLPLTQTRKDYEILPEVMTVHLTKLPEEKPKKKTAFERFLGDVGKITIPTYIPFVTDSYRKVSVKEIAEGAGEIAGGLRKGGEKVVKEIGDIDINPVSVYTGKHVKLKELPIKETAGGIIKGAEKGLVTVTSKTGFIGDIPLTPPVYVKPPLLDVGATKIQPITIKGLIGGIEKLPIINRITGEIETEHQLEQRLNKDSEDLQPILDRMAKRRKEIDALPELKITKQLQNIVKQFENPKTTNEQKQRLYNSYQKLINSPEYKEELKVIKKIKKAYVDEQEDIKKANFTNFYTETSPNGEVTFKHKYYNEEDIKKLRPNYRNKTLKESVMHYLFRKTGVSYERAYTDIAQFGFGQLNPLTPFKTLESGEQYSPSSLLVGKGVRLAGFDVPSYYFPYIRGARIFGGTTEKTLKGELPQFTKEEPLEVGLAGLYGGAFIATRAPRWLREWELQQLKQVKPTQPSVSFGFEKNNGDISKLIIRTKKTFKVDIFGRKIPLAKQDTFVSFKVHGIRKPKGGGYDWFKLESGKGLTQISTRGFSGRFTSEKVPFTFFGEARPTLGGRVVSPKPKNTLYQPFSKEITGVHGKVRLMTDEGPFTLIDSKFLGLQRTKGDISALLTGPSGRVMIRTKPFYGEDIAHIFNKADYFTLPSTAKPSVRFTPDAVGIVKRLSKKEQIEILKKLTEGTYEIVVEKGKLKVLKYFPPLFPKGKKAERLLTPLLIQKPPVKETIKVIHLSKELSQPEIISPLETVGRLSGQYISTTSLKLLHPFKTQDLTGLSLTSLLISEPRTKMKPLTKLREIERFKELTKEKEKTKETEKTKTTVTPLYRTTQVSKVKTEPVELTTTTTEFSLTPVREIQKFKRPRIPLFDLYPKPKKLKKKVKKKKKVRKYKPRPTGFEAALGLKVTRPRKKEFTGFEPLRFI